MHDDYKQMVLPSEHTLEPCPVCGSKPELWQYSEDETSPVTKLVACSMGEPIGPQDGVVFAGCPLYMPPNNFYRATIREAVKFWNEMASALRVMRERKTKPAAFIHPTELQALADRGHATVAAKRNGKSVPLFLGGTTDLHPEEASSGGKAEPAGN